MDKLSWLDSLPHYTIICAVLAACCRSEWARRTLPGSVKRQNDEVYAGLIVLAGITLDLILFAGSLGE